MRRAPLSSLGLALVFGAALGCKKPPAPLDPAELETAPLPEPVPAEPATPVEPPRCIASTDAPYVLGDAPGADPADETALPFAAEVGQGVALAKGFALGAIRPRAGGTEALVVTLDEAGREGRTITLGTLHGDVDPPRIAARGDALVAAVVEPEPNARALRLVRVEGEKVVHGATIREARDESQGYDLALGDSKGVVVWDEETNDGGRIRASTFDAASASAATPPRTISPTSADADSPRLVARPGGWFLAYVARRDDGDVPDARYVAETIGFRWVEVVPLDALGSPVGVARAVTPKDGHVMAFDVAPTSDGAAIVYRDDDTPSGSAGGRVMRVAVSLGSVGAPSVLADDGAGAGSPDLVGAWLSIADVASPTRIAPLREGAELAGSLRAEPAIGSGEPIAAGEGGRLLVARPSGRAVKLFVVACVAASAAPAASASAAPSAN